MMDLDLPPLPQEVLTHTFQFLNVRERLVASLVCKKWLQAIDCPKLLRNIQIKFSKEIDEAVALFSHMTRRFQWFTFRNITIKNSVFKFLKQYSRQFVKLMFFSCEVVCHKVEFEFQDGILNCDNLMHLCIEDSDVIDFFASLPNVTHLRMRLRKGLTDSIISKLDRCLLKLESLSLYGHVLDDEMGDKQYFLHGDTVQINPLNDGLSFDNLINFMEKQSNTLKFIDFFRLQLSPEDTVSISEIRDLKLKRIFFSPWFYPGHIKELCGNQLSLTNIDFSLSLHLTNDTVWTVCECLPNLEALVIRDNYRIDDCIIAVFQLQHLTKLSISRCCKISDDSFHKAILNLKVFKLKELKLGYIEISDDNLFQLLKHNVHIRSLHLVRVSISNKTLNMVCKNLTDLETLHFSDCEGISDSGLTGEFECYSDSLSPTPISKLTNMRKLVLIEIPFITNNGCIKAIHFPKLEILFLSDCDGLRLENDFHVILERQNPKLQWMCIYTDSVKYQRKIT